VLRTICILAVTLLVPLQSSAEIFKCTAKNGLALYQNFPCDIDSLGSLPTQPTGARIGAEHGGPVVQPPSGPRVPPTEPRAGMTADEVRAMWGAPAEIVQDEPPSGRIEIWKYADGRVVQINVKQRVISIQR
jgi:hypothetical protein